MSPRSKASTRLARVGAIPPSDGATPPSPEAQNEILARIPAAVVNAIADALAPLGVRPDHLPLTPARLWALAEAAGAALR